MVNRFATAPLAMLENVAKGVQKDTLAILLFLAILAELRSVILLVRGRLNRTRTDNVLAR